MRGALNAQDFAEKTLTLINDTVPEDGILYFLGDMFLNTTDEKCVAWLSGIKCKHIRVLWGNHESNMYRIYKQMVKDVFQTDTIEVYPFSHKMIPNVEFMGNHLEIQVGKKRIILNHFPLRIYNGSHRTAWHLSGHSHLNDPERRPEFPIGKTVDVGIDYGKIWSFNDIEDIMSTKDVNLIDHHDKNTN
jgi:calcineurin-like phosphoesterase family protein